MKYLYLISLSVITNIALYSTFVNGFFNLGSFTIKSSAILNHSCNDVCGNFSNLYNL